MKVLIKVCGITELGGARAAWDARVDAIGFVFSHSPRRVTPDRAASLSSSIGEEVLKVAVFARPTAGEVEAVLAEFAPDVVQADIEARSAVPESMRFLPVFHQDRLPKDLPDDCFLLDSSRSGSGELTDWDRAARLAASGRLILAGGLGPANVAEAIATVRPLGVDVSSGVERKRGMKDPKLIASFVAAVRAAETATVRP